MTISVVITSFGVFLFIVFCYLCLLSNPYTSLLLGGIFGPVKAVFGPYAFEI